MARLVAPGSAPRRYAALMEDADIVRAELDLYFTSEVEEALAALTEAQQRLDNWRRTGAQSRPDGIAAWKLAAANALDVALRKALRTART
jgi:hypothetical protein